MNDNDMKEWQRGLRGSSAEGKRKLLTGRE